jgi:hypothetical protein
MLLADDIRTIGDPPVDPLIVKFETFVPELLSPVSVVIPLRNVTLPAFELPFVNFPLIDTPPPASIMRVRPAPAPEGTNLMS